MNRFGLALCGALSAFAPFAANSQSRRAFTPDDVNSWKDLLSVLLTPDGEWTAYAIYPHYHEGEVTGEVSVVVRSTHGSESRSYSAGEVSGGAGQLEMSKSGKWIAFLTAPSLAEVKRIKDGKDPVRTKLTLVETASGKQQEFSDVQSFDFSHDGDDRLILYGYPTPQGMSQGSTVIVVDCDRGSDTIRGVTSHSLSKQGTRLATVAGGVLAVANLQTRALKSQSTHLRRAPTRASAGPRQGIHSRPFVAAIC
jgi:hypothetical protein